MQPEWIFAQICRSQIYVFWDFSEILKFLLCLWQCMWSPKYWWTKYIKSDCEVLSFLHLYFCVYNKRLKLLLVYVKNFNNHGYGSDYKEVWIYELTSFILYVTKVWFLHFWFKMYFFRSGANCKWVISQRVVYVIKANIC